MESIKIKRNPDNEIKPSMPINNILLYCRPGFEKECTSEIMALTTEAGIYGYVKSKPDSGYVVYHTQPAVELAKLNQSIHFDELMFARQCVFAADIIKDLPSDNRISPLLSHIQSFNLSFNDAWLETPDTNDGKQLSTFCKKFANPLRKALDKNQLLVADSPWRLHLFFLNSSAVYIGVSAIDNSSALLMGIPRLRMPRSAPSRSTLKLEEAFKTMLSDDEQKHYLRNGMTGVDLGAAPGGWTWQLVNRGIRVTAIDNGPMNDVLMDTGLVKHERVDGFKYTPEKPVDWLVCDMVERPLHIARLISRWLSEGHCHNAAFNLKLPMKQRYDIVKQCQNLIESDLCSAGIQYRIKIKQLYHDREEVTVVILKK